MKYTKLIILTFALTFAFLAESNGQDIGFENQLSNSSISLKNTIDIYPNPAVEYLIIELSNSDMKDVEFEMYSLIGNKIKIQPQQIGDFKYKIPVKDFSSGYYFLTLKDKKKRFEKAMKFLKN